MHFKNLTHTQAHTFLQLLVLNINQCSPQLYFQLKNTFSKWADQKMYCSFNNFLKIWRQICFQKKLNSPRHYHKAHSSACWKQEPTLLKKGLRDFRWRTQHLPQGNSCLFSLLQPTNKKKQHPAIHYISVSPQSGSLPGNRIQLAKCTKAFLISVPNIQPSFIQLLLGGGLLTRGLQRRFSRRVKPTH